jgi:DNA-binding NarL/FixJ family response regulator
LIKDIARQLPATRVVVFSMHEEAYYAERALRAGALGYVTKSESTDRIVDAIRAVRKGEIYGSAPLLAQLAKRMVGGSATVATDFVEVLSDREMDVFRRLGEGQTTRQIAEESHVSIKTIQAYCARIKVKLRIASGAELVREAVRWVEQSRPR